MICTQVYQGFGEDFKFVILLFIFEALTITWTNSNALILVARKMII